MTRSSARGALWISALACAAAACSDGTRVDVYFEAEPSLEAAASAIEIEITGTDGEIVLTHVEALGADRALPVGVRLEPEGGATGRSFLAVGRLLDGARAPIARVAGGGAYEAGVAGELRLRFTAGCGAGLDCVGPATCVEGACGPACPPGLSACGVTPLDAGLDAGTDGGRDAGDAGGADAGAPDAGVDGGPLEVDGGVHTPVFVERTVARFDTATPGTYVSALGAPLAVDATGGPWMVMVSAGLSSTSSASSATVARLMVDGVEAVLGSSHVDNASGAGPWSGFALLSGGRSHTVDVELNAFIGGTTASMHELRVLAFPLPAGTVVYTQEALVNVLYFPGEGWRTLAELRFTPTSTGRHLVLAQASVTRLPSLTGAAGVRLEQGGGAQWPLASGDPPHLASATADYQTFFLARAPSLTSGVEAVFTLQSLAAPSNSNASHARLVAIDLSSFGATVHDEQPAAGTTSSAAANVIARANAPAGPVRDWIVIGSISLLAAGTRGAEIAAGPLTRRYTHPYAAAGRIPYPFFGGFSRGEAFAGTSAAFASGATVEHREAVVHLLGL